MAGWGIPVGCMPDGPSIREWENLVEEEREWRKTDEEKEFRQQETILVLAEREQNQSVTVFKASESIKASQSVIHVPQDWGQMATAINGDTSF